MKEKILYLVIGILVGAIITASCFLVVEKNKKVDVPEGMPNFEEMDKNGRRPDFENMKDGERPELPEGFNESQIPEDMKKNDENTSDTKENRKNKGKSNTENESKDSTSTNESV